MENGSGEELQKGTRGGGQAVVEFKQYAQVYRGKSWQNENVKRPRARGLQERNWKGKEIREIETFAITSK